MKQIIITVSPAGGTKIETKGYAGTSCRDASKPYESALGLRTAENLTAEFSKQAEQEKARQ